MSNIYYRDYRIEIRPCVIPDGWSAQIDIWSCYDGTTHMTPLPLPTHFAFATVVDAHAHAEMVAGQWVVDLVPHDKTRPPQKPGLVFARQRAR
jgi:hypothetical protein